MNAFNLIKTSVAIILFWIISGRTIVAWGQVSVVQGFVMDERGLPLVGASVHWLGTSAGIFTDDKGAFRINAPIPTDTSDYLVFGFVGFWGDTVLANDEWVMVSLRSRDAAFSTVEVIAKATDHSISTIALQNTERIGSSELRKAACCNLSESFSTNGSVSLNYTDAVVGAKEIEMLGLRGVYTQMLLENRPMMRGLGYTFGMEFVPGTWISGIDISKGASAVSYGYESVAGQINTRLINPFEGERFFLNLFANQFGRVEVNAHLHHRFSKKWATGLLLHTDYFDNEKDHNHDRFLDMTLKKQLNAMYRLAQRGEKITAAFSLQHVRHDQQTGQLGFRTAAVSDSLYAVHIEIEKTEFFGKLGYIGFKNPFASAGLVFGANAYRQRASFGYSPYNGQQRSVFVQGLYENILGASDQKIRTGFSFLLDDYQENFDILDLSKQERIGGIFAEYAYTRSYHNGNTFELLAGGRLDHHNQYGWLITPRLHLLFKPNVKTALRLSAGRGYRTAHLLAENISALTSARRVVVDKNLNIEAAWNIGLNLSKQVEIRQSVLSLALDLYRTDFQQQVVVDMEQADVVSFYNLAGRSFSNSAMLLAKMDWSKRFSTKLTYKFSDVRTTYEQTLRQRPLVPRHRLLAVASYAVPQHGWKLHLTANWTGKQRLANVVTQAGSPHHASLPDYRLEGIAPAYFMLNGQVNKVFGERWEVYAGAENATSYTQTQPILGAENPFGTHPDQPVFDASQVYAPVMGRVWYTGLRWKIE